MAIVFKDPEQAELGTHTYRCKGCNGKGCRWCCFGDMWESEEEINTEAVNEYIFGGKKQ